MTKTAYHLDYTVEMRDHAFDRVLSDVEKEVIRDVIDQALTNPIPQSDKIRISRAKYVYTMKDVTYKKYQRKGWPLTCHYHKGDKGKAIEVGQVVYSASTTRTRTFIILAHLECAMRMGLVLPEELDGKFTSSQSSLS